MADLLPGVVMDRTALLALYDIDAGGFEALDEITAFGAALCDAPICVVSLVDEDSQHFVSRTGLDADGTPRSMSFCNHAMRQSGLMLVPDARLDPRFADNPLVTGKPHIRFYAGAPLVDTDGSQLGSLCVIDIAPRAALTPLQGQGLLLLAKQVMTFLHDRRRDREVEARLKRKREAMIDSETRFRTLADAIPQMVWSATVDGQVDYFNERWYEFTGLPEGTSEGDRWIDVVHPDDRERAGQVWGRSLETGQPYQIEYRLRNQSGEYRGALGRALPIRDSAGRITRWIGSCTDIHEQALMIEEREMIAHELSHRIKNIFSVIAGLIGLSARARPEIRDAADDLRDRVLALGRAHDFVRPHSAESRRGLDFEQSSLHGLLHQLFAPYGDRVLVSGDDPRIDDRSATPLALIFHELATNAAKYGALSVPDGQVHLTLSPADDVDGWMLEWRERGGPAPVQTGSAGFGTRLMALSAERQLGGKVDRQWLAEGLLVRLTIPSRSMSRAVEMA